MKHMKPASRQAQQGAAAVELAVVGIVFIAMVIAIMEFARVMYVMATAVEATRLGARVAVVCDIGDAAIKARMKTMLKLLEPANIDIVYPASQCSAAQCDPVTVRIKNVTLDTHIPLVPLSFTLPEFATSLPSESLNSAGNPLCNG